MDIEMFGKISDAFGPSGFGKGAVEAAKFLAGKTAGMYDMSDVIQF